MIRNQIPCGEGHEDLCSWLCSLRKPVALWLGPSTQMHNCNKYYLHLFVPKMVWVFVFFFFTPWERNNVHEVNVGNVGIDVLCCEKAAFQKQSNIPQSSYMQWWPKGYNSDLVTYSFILNAAFQKSGAWVNKNRLVCSTNVCRFQLCPPPATPYPICLHVYEHTYPLRKKRKV